MKQILISISLVLIFTGWCLQGITSIIRGHKRKKMFMAPVSIKTPMEGRSNTKPSRGNRSMDR